MVDMRVQLLYFDGCPHRAVLEERLRGALELLDEPSKIEQVRVETQAEAERLGFVGSPSVLIDGIDPFASPADTVGLSCRVYSTADGLSGSPTLDQVVAVLRAAR
jgi:hypothetical protein